MRGRLVALVTTLVALLTGPACKKREAPLAADAGGGSPAATVAPPPRLDGPFAATSTSRGEPVVVASGPESLGLASFDAAGKPSVRALRVPQGAPPFTGASSAFSFADGRMLLVVTDAKGAAFGAVAAVDGTLGAFSPVGVESCATSDTFFFVERSAHAVYAWASSAAAPAPVSTGAVREGTTLLCGKRAAFAFVPLARGLAVMVVAAGAAARRVELAKALDPASAGDFAAYVTDDRAGIVYAGEGDLLHAADVDSAGAVTDRAFKRKLGPTESVVGADLSGGDVVALVQHEEKGRCGDEETPPAYTAVDLVRERVFALPKITCDVESSPPVLELAAGKLVARWFESKDDGHEKRLRQWAIAVGETNERAAAITAVSVPDSASLLDCDARCLAVARDGGSFRVIATLP
ncbi:MAG: hypothetical protein U0235_20960 [Polyangiaceae bacterium]